MLTFLNIIYESISIVCMKSYMYFNINSMKESRIYIGSWPPIVTNFKYISCTDTTRCKMKKKQ